MVISSFFILLYQPAEEPEGKAYQLDAEMLCRNGNDGKDDSQMRRYLDQICLCNELLHNYLLSKPELMILNILYLNRIKASLKVY